MRSTSCSSTVMISAPGEAAGHRRRVGLALSEHTDGDGALVFQQACRMGLEAIASKRRGAVLIGPVAGLDQVTGAGSPSYPRASRPGTRAKSRCPGR
jgi:hypothetical protein